MAENKRVVDDSDSTAASSEGPSEDVIDYRPFVEATVKGEWSAMKQFLDSHPGAATVPVDFGRTALHYLLWRGKTNIGGLLVEEMKPEDLEIINDNGFTAFSLLCNYDEPGVLELLQRMVAKNANLPNIGMKDKNIPIVHASFKGSSNKDTINYLYSVTRDDVLNPDHSGAGVCLLVNCIDSGLFDIASVIVCKFPRALRPEGANNITPIFRLAKYFLKYGRMSDESSKYFVIHVNLYVPIYFYFIIVYVYIYIYISLGTFKLNNWVSRLWKYVKQYYMEHILGEYDLTAVSDDIDKLEYDKAYAFLRLVCGHVSSFDWSMLQRYVYRAMIEASKDGIVEFVCEMLMANPKLVESYDSRGSIFTHAIENRQEKVYCIVYNFIGIVKDRLSRWGNGEEGNNILHLVAKLPPTAAIDRTSGPAMAMQREVLWFEEIWSMAHYTRRHALNREGLTPRDLFAREHKELIHEGERAMKETANSAAFVGALILTVTFAAAFTVPGGNNEDGLPILLRKALFKIFVVCDALSLYSAIASILAILGILTSSFAKTDFLFKSPRRLMIGLWSLWFSLLTMMLGFCAVLALTLDGLFRYILPVTLLLLIPVILFMSPIFPLCLEIYRATYATNLFDKTSSLQDRIDKNMAMRRGVNAKKLPAKVEVNVISSDPSTGNIETV